MHFKNRTQNGFTFIETIMTVAIFSLVMIAVTGSIIYFYRANAYAIEQSFAVNSARKGVELMVRDIREAAYSEEGAYPLIDVSTSSVSFYSDVDRDDNIERIQYVLDDTILTKGVTDPVGNPPEYLDQNENVSNVSTDVRNGLQDMPVFRYYDRDGAEVTDFEGGLGDIAFVTVDLIVNINPSRLPNEFNLKSSATIRNLKTNL